MSVHNLQSKLECTDLQKNRALSATMSTASMTMRSRRTAAIFAISVRSRVRYVAPAVYCIDHVGYASNHALTSVILCCCKIFLVFTARAYARAVLGVE